MPQNKDEPLCLPNDDVQSSVWADIIFSKRSRDVDAVQP